MTIYDDALKAHKEWRGKLDIHSKAQIKNNDDLSLAYTPGVAEPCRQIAADEATIYDYTWKGNVVAVVTDGSAVLGLGNIGPKAALPVMEGKSILFKDFAGVDAVPICLDTQDPKEIIQIVKAIAPGFGGINLEDISAPRCVEIERTLIDELDIPVFHDDQHGTAIVVTAALINSLKLVNKEKEDIKVIISGAGAAGSSIAKMLHLLGIKNILSFNIDGIISKINSQHADFLTKEIAEITNPENEEVSFKDAFIGADVFIGVSAPGIVTKEMIASMNPNSIVFALANPEPEITYEDAVEAGATIIGTGRSDFPNQINNVLAFPGLFKGAFLVRGRKITEGMKLAAATGIASIIPDDELRPDYIIPSAFNPDVADTVAKAVAEEYLKEFPEEV